MFPFRKRFKLIFIFAFLLLSAFTSYIPHPPEFKHFIENQSIEKNIELNKAMQFTERDMQKIMATREPIIIAAAGIQARKDEPLGTEALIMASNMENPKGLATVSLVDRYFDIMYDGKQELSVDASLKESITKLQQKSDSNALIYYLNAYIQQQYKGDDGEAIKQLQRGNTVEHFKGYSKQRYQAVVEASEFIGYSKFTARVHSMYYFVPSNIYMRLFDLCRHLIAGEQSDMALKECHVMGQKIEKESQNYAEKLFGLGFQEMYKAGSESSLGSSINKNLIKKKKQVISDNESRLSKNANALSEDDWIKYYQILFEKNEEAAIIFVDELIEKKKK